MKIIGFGIYILAAFIFCYYLSFILPRPVIIGVYPYILVTFVTLIIGIVIIYFTKNLVTHRVIKILLMVFVILMVLTIIQIYRNASLQNGYQKNRSIYMDELMNMTDEKEYDTGGLETSQRKTSVLVEKTTGMPLTYYNKALVLNTSKEIFEEIIQEMEGAEDHIHIEFYIIRDDCIGERFKKILKEKTKEGVEVRIIYDSLGSWNLERKFIKELRDAGAEIFAYEGIITSILKGKLNHRNHRKIVIVDGKIAFTGGVNIGDEYLDRDKTIGNWEDIGLKIEGEGVSWIQKIFLADWYYVTNNKLLDNRYFPRTNINKTLPVQIITSGYDTHWNEVGKLFFSMITSAVESVYIATPYLILNDSMLNALETVALSGVKVNIILPNNPDSIIVGWANASYFERLLKSGVNIYKYNDGFLHSKAIMIDKKSVSLGSANLNTRSTNLDYELNMVIYDGKLARKVLDIFKNYIKDSLELTLDDYQNRSISQKLKEFIGKLIIPFA